jgi:hypothetical protein
MTQPECIVVERSFDEQRPLDELQSAERRVAWCFEQKGVRVRRSFVSLDGCAMVCVYDARDAESVRETQRTAGLPFTRAWRALLMAHGDAVCAPAGRSTVIVERDPPPGMREEHLRALMSVSGPCFQTNGVELLTTYLAADSSRVICVFSAFDAEAVRRANREGGLPFTRAWTATHHG